MSGLLYVIFNGPPHVGKTAMARELASCLTKAGITNEIDSFAKPFKQFFATALGDKWTDMDKVRVRPELNGYTLRQAWIGMAEDYVKHVYGEDAFGRWLVHRSLRFPDHKMDVYIVDDGGFIPEIEAVQNRWVIRVTRPGCDFTNDSRSYYPHYRSLIENNRKMIDLWMKVAEVSTHIIRYMEAARG